MKDRHERCGLAAKEGGGTAVSPGRRCAACGLPAEDVGTWSLTAVIHARSTRYFWAFAAYFFFTTTSIAFITPRLPATW